MFVSVILLTFTFTGVTEAAYVFNRDIDCGYPPVPGPCKNFEQMIYYESHEGECKNFTYGGCGGNTNFFTNLEDCMTACNGSNATPYETTPTPSTTTLKTYPGLDPICSLPMDQGNCSNPGDDTGVAFYYSELTGGCSAFIYCGNGGNENRFEGEVECTEFCITGISTTVSTTEEPPTTMETIRKRVTVPSTSTLPFPLQVYRRVTEQDCRDATALRILIFSWIGECALTCDRYRPRCNAFAYDSKTLFCKLLVECNVKADASRRVVTTTLSWKVLMGLRDSWDYHESAKEESKTMVYWQHLDSHKY